MRKAQVSPRITEAALQAQIVEGLRAMGYEVLVTSARSVRQGYGADHGVPDLLVSHCMWPPAMWLGLEIKRPGPVKWSHPAQERLWREFRTAVARSLEDAAAAIRHVQTGPAEACVPTVETLARSISIERIYREVFAFGA